MIERNNLLPFVCECDYRGSILLDSDTASWCKVCDLHRTSCLVACMVVCSAIHKDVLLGKLHSLQFFLLLLSCCVQESVSYYESL